MPLGWEIKSFSWHLTFVQKVILSLSFFSILLVISYALAEYVDYEVKMRKTWQIWVGFIFFQAWFQNMFWSTGLSITITLKIPYLTGVKDVCFRLKKPILTALSAISFFCLINLSIKPINNFIEERELKQKEAARINYENNLTAELSKIRVYETKLLLSEKSYGLVITLQSDDPDYLNLEFEILCEETYNLGDFLNSKFPSAKKLVPDFNQLLKQAYHTNLCLDFYSRNGNASYCFELTDLQFDRELLSLDVFKKEGHDFLDDEISFKANQRIFIKGRRELFLDIDSIRVVDDVNSHRFNSTNQTHYPFFSELVECTYSTS